MGILKIIAKCSDLCYTRFIDNEGNETESNGYVPPNIGLNEDNDWSDYVRIEIDMETGQILNWKSVSDADVIEAQKNV